MCEPPSPPDKDDRLRVATLSIWGRFAEWPRRRALLAEQLPRLDYLLYRSIWISASGRIPLRDAAWSASDHLLVWADVAPTNP